MEHDKEKSCDGCPDRVADPNCHDTCKYHIRRQEKNEKKKAARREELDYVGATCDAVKRTKSTRSPKSLARRKHDR